MTAIAVTIAGSDSGGGAGIQADLKTFSALGVYGASVITALTAQNTQGVTAIHEAPAAFVRAEIDAVFSDLAVDAVKIGMLASPELIETVAAGLAAFPARPIVLDPVMVATSGDLLLREEAVETLVRVLLPKALLITPNLAEGARLSGTGMAESREAMVEQARRLKALGPGAVLLKGGHGSGPEAADVLVDDRGVTWFTARRHPTRNTHGTGCTLSSAIAAGLALGKDLVTAVTEAKAYVTDAVVAADGLSVGRGNGPVHHFHRLWPLIGR
jgi:hydroxymethylpyrimidine/phosphomethylpyrimidine kinase